MADGVMFLVLGSAIRTMDTGSTRKSRSCARLGEADMQTDAAPHQKLFVVYYHVATQSMIFNSSSARPDSAEARRRV